MEYRLYSPLGQPKKNFYAGLRLNGEGDDRKSRIIEWN